MTYVFYHVFGDAQDFGDGTDIHGIIDVGPCYVHLAWGDINTFLTYIGNTDTFRDGSAVPSVTCEVVDDGGRWFGTAIGLDVPGKVWGDLVLVRGEGDCAGLRVVPPNEQTPSRHLGCLRWSRPCQEAVGCVLVDGGGSESGIGRGARAVG
jgi:hypothetical protein